MRTLSIAAALVALALATTPATARAQAQTPPPNRGDAPGGGPLRPPPGTGAQVYRQVCPACHMADAKGGAGAAVIPSLAANPRLGTSVYPISLVVHGRGAMPGFTDLLNPTQIAAVVAYVRTHFGNAYPKPVTEADVARIEGPKPTP